MKLKYFMRGLGLGILLTTILLSIAFRYSDTYKLSTEEIIQEAEKLGMVKNKEPQVDIEQLLEKEKTNKTDKSNLQENTKETETTSKETIKDTKKEEESKQDESDLDLEIEIEILPGMTSEHASNLLMEEGIIEDKIEFNSYIVENGYSTRVRSGVFKIPKNSTYKEIAKILIGN